MSDSRTDGGLSRRFRIGWAIFQLVVWSLCAAWVNPSLLSWVGLHGAAAWVAHHAWIRVVAFPPLGLLLLLSAFRPVDQGPRRRALESVASSIGGTIVDRAGATGLGPGALLSGPALRVPCGPWTIEIAHILERRLARVRAHAAVQTVGSFRFLAAGAGTDRARHTGFAARGMKAALEIAQAEGSDPRRSEAMASLSYLAEPPTPSGVPSLDACMTLWTSDADTARRLFGDPSVVAALAALHATTDRWEWTLAPGTDRADGELFLFLSGSRTEPETLRRLHAVMAAGLEALDEARLVIRPVESGGRAA